MARIVIVDDNLMMRTRLRQILTDAGHAVVGEASDGLQAPDVVRSAKPDLVTLDMRMPGRDGLPTLQHLRLRNPDLAVVVISANVDQRRVIDALKLGARDFVPKPFSPEAVVTSVAKALEPSGASA
jgi:two-component system chemotaxis response regulator CheY